MLSKVTASKYYSNEERRDDDFFRCDEFCENDADTDNDTSVNVGSAVELKVLELKFQEQAHSFYITYSFLAGIIIFLQMLP
jgi:hypothetical protein